MVELGELQGETAKKWASKLSEPSSELGRGKGRSPFFNALFQKKSTPPWRKACWKISREGGGVTALEIQTGEGLRT